MQISKNKVVSINYTLKDDSGQVIDTSEGGEPLAYLHGAENIIPGLESALAGKASGDSLSVSIPPAEAYGEHDESKVQAVPRELFDDAGEVVVDEQGIIPKQVGMNHAGWQSVVTMLTLEVELGLQ